MPSLNLFLKIKAKNSPSIGRNYRIVQRVKISNHGQPIENFRDIAVCIAPATLATETPSLGIEMASLGIEMASLGTEMASLGTETASLGIETASLGIETATLGTETASLSIKMASLPFFSDPALKF